MFELIFSGETLTKKSPFNLGFLFHEFRRMFKAPDFFYGMFMCGISYGLVMFYNLCGPFIIEHRLGFSAITTGYVSLLMGFAWMCGGFLGKFLINKSFLPKIRYANFAQIALIIVMFASSFWISNLYTLAIFAFLIHVTAGFIFNNYFTYCMGRFPDSAGIAGGLTGGMAFIVTSALSYGVVAAIKPISQDFVAVGYFVMALLGLAILSLVKIRKAHT